MNAETIHAAYTDLSAFRFGYDLGVHFAEEASEHFVLPEGIPDVVTLSANSYRAAVEGGERSRAAFDEGVKTGVARFLQTEKQIAWEERCAETDIELLQRL